MTNKPNVAYDVDTLTTEELRAIVKAVHDQYMAEMTGKATAGDMLGADFEELHGEYKFWLSKLKERVAYEETKDN